MTDLARLEVVTAAFRHDLEAADLEARCTSIAWTVAELAVHLGEVHRWAALSARDGVRHDRGSVPGPGVSVVEWYSESRGILLETLSQLYPETSTYTLSRSDPTVRFWHRRQLHETLVHLWDLRSAFDPEALPAAEMSPQVHADGVSELFDVFLPRARDLDPLGATVALIATDTGDRWSFGPQWQRDTATLTDATVSAPASELLLYAWNRADRVERRGDTAVLARFEAAPLRP